MSGLNGAAIFVIQTLGSLYLLIVLLRFILQLVRANFYNPLCQFTVRATQPLLKPMRRVIPSLFGLAMQPGDLISLGSFSPLLPPKAGLSVMATYDGLPGAAPVRVTFK